MRGMQATSFTLLCAALVGCEERKESAGPEAPGAVPAEARKSPETDPTVRPRTETRATERQRNAVDARELVADAANALENMRSDDELMQLLEKSKGVLIVPSYGRAAVGVGVRGGEGVLLGHRDGEWSGPVFYDIGGISVGPQFGASGGEIAMVLMSEQALAAFEEDENFSLNADAKLTLVDYSGLALASLGKGGDVVFWSDTEGAFLGAALGVTDISFDDEENQAYYRRGTVTVRDILSGKIAAPDDDLQQELSKR